MEYVIPPEQFAARLLAVEQETAALRRELSRLYPAPKAQPLNHSGIQFVDQKMLTAAIDQLFAEWGIDTTVPVNILELQEEMRKAGLEPNELSRGIIEMRDE
jgi:hypothetical protein